MTETSFGFESVTKDEKKERVDNVFSSVSDVYDTMNNTMSFGIHHIWKKHALHALNCHHNAKVIDLACGSGDVSELIHSRIHRGHLYCVDPNEHMLARCKKRLGNAQNISYHLFYAENMEISVKVDRIITSFGLRNFSDIPLALKNIYNHLEVGGKLVILEFNPPDSTGFKHHYQLYLDRVIPFWGKVVGHDEDSYQYLSDSICVQPSPDERISELKTAGFDFITHTPLSLGIVGLFEAYRCK